MTQADDLERPSHKQAQYAMTHTMTSPIQARRAMQVHSKLLEDVGLMHCVCGAAAYIGMNRKRSGDRNQKY